MIVDAKEMKGGKENKIPRQWMEVALIVEVHSQGHQGLQPL